MFSVIFEVNPRPDQWDAYLGYAKMLRPELEQIDGFIDNIRYRSLTREGWILSLSGWQDEKALIRWRTRANHHDVQQMGRDKVLLDYHLRVGQVTSDTRSPDGDGTTERALRQDLTETGGKALTVMDAKCPADWVKNTRPEEIAKWFGFDTDASGLMGWDVYDGVLNPGDAILAATWRDHATAEAFSTNAAPPEGARVRCVRIIRDYGMYDRREAPQYYPDKQRSEGCPVGKASLK
jgi:heme-degrading monooxygenase HmoA